MFTAGWELAAYEAACGGCDGGSDDDAGCERPLKALARLKDDVGAGKLGLLAGAEVFWRAMFASASRMDWPFCAGGAGAAFAPSEAATFAGGLPGGVVEVSGTLVRLEELERCKGSIIIEGDVLGGGGALVFSLNDSSIGAGNVWPFSQMSSSFLIFSYKARIGK